MFKFPYFLLALTFTFVFGTCSAETTIVITCASGELGHAIARVLAEDSNLILTGRDMDKLGNLQAELAATHPWKYEICSLDYSSDVSIAAFKNRFLGNTTAIAGLVLMTPRPNQWKNILQDQSDWLQLFQTAFTGPIEALKSTLPRLGSQSKIVIISGVTSVQLMPEHGPASVLRRMWTTYSKALSHQLGPKGIRVNVLSPDAILTTFHQERIANAADAKGLSFEEELTREVATIPLRRRGMPSEVAKAVKFFITDASDFISGVNLVLDGGATVSY